MPLWLRTLTPKFLALILALSLLNMLFTVQHAEHQMEQAILDQVKKQALAFLQGIDRRMNNREILLEDADLAQLLREALPLADSQGFDFSVNSLYVYDRQGRIRAHTRSGVHPDKKLDGKYGLVLSTGQPFIGEHLETDGVTDAQGADHPVLDIILPLEREGGVVAGLEAELDMYETMQRIHQADDRYEDALGLTLLFHALLLAALFWFVVQRLMVKPIGHLDRITQAIGNGNLTARVRPTGSGDELDRLSLSVNHMADNIQRLIAEQEEAYMQSLRSLMQALEAKDDNTAAHSTRVAHYSVLLGRSLGLDDDTLRLLRKGALMHDLGKIGIPDEVLRKPHALTDAEYAAMQSHPRHTANIMRPLTRFKEFAQIAAWHHERWDGTGYPDGLKGEEIPLLARIVSIADTWDAMTGDRVYRRGMPPQRAASILRKERDSGQLDPILLERFLSLVDSPENTATN
ncbi:MAG: HD domain-containing protein [Magnetococcus sp. WYHC-3]